VKILITGASGFIGSQLLKAACNTYGSENVIAFSSQAYEHCDTVVYDHNDYSINKSDCALLKSVDVLLHAGAFTPKSGKVADNIDGCNSNISFTEKLLKLPLEKLTKIIYLSTLDVYAHADVVTEETPTMPQTLYGQSKLYCEKMLAAFSAQRKIDCLVLRVGHVYGPGEEAYAKFIPLAIQRIIDNKRVELWGDGSELRSFIYIEDVVKGIMNSLILDEEVDVINVVGGVALSIRQLLDYLITISGKQVEIDELQSDVEARDLVFSTKKFAKYLRVEETDIFVGLECEYNYMNSLR
jgi:UDP-glucose 4-epimerase